MTPARKSQLMAVCLAAGWAFALGGCQHRSERVQPSSDSPPPTATAPVIQWQPPVIADPRPAPATCQLLIAACRSRLLLMTPLGQAPAVIERLETWQAPGALPILYVQGVTRSASGARFGCYLLLFFNATGACCNGAEFSWPIGTHRLDHNQLALSARDYAGRRLEYAQPIPTNADLDRMLEDDHFMLGEVFTPLDRPARDYAQFEAVFGRIDPGEDRGAMERHRRLAACTAPDGGRYELVDLARGWNTACSRHWTRRLVLFDTANRPVAQWIVNREIDWDRVTTTTTGFVLPSETPGQAPAHIDFKSNGGWHHNDPAGLLVMSPQPACATP